MNVADLSNIRDGVAYTFDLGGETIYGEALTQDSNEIAVKTPDGETRRFSPTSVQHRCRPRRRMKAAT
jgi:hypothetical protein